MKKIDKNELQFLYALEVEDARNSYNRLIINNEYPLENQDGADIVDGCAWKDELNDTLDMFDSFADQMGNYSLLEEKIVQKKSSDRKIRQVANENMMNIRTKNKVKKEIRKTQYEDAMSNLKLLCNNNENLEDDEVIKELWLNAKIQIRNTMSKLLENLGDLQTIERFIECRNNII